MEIITKYNAGQVFVLNNGYEYKVVEIDNIKINIKNNISIEIEYHIDGRYVNENWIDYNTMTLEETIDSIKNDFKNFTSYLSR